jgi:hypothetical protein
VCGVPYPRNRREPAGYLLLACVFGCLAGGLALLGLCTGSVFGLSGSLPVLLLPAAVCLALTAVFLLADVRSGRSR